MSASICGNNSWPQGYCRNVTDKPAVKPATDKPAAETGVQTYTVVKGDTLFKIAHKFYNDGKLWPKIFDANKDKIKDKSKLPIGLVLKIPPK